MGMIFLAADSMDVQVGMNASAVWHAVIMVWGGSRRLLNTMHLMSEKGQGSYVESFLTHAAHDHDLKVWGGGAAEGFC